MAAEADRQLVLVVEGTAALGPHWPKLQRGYIQKILSAFCRNNREGQNLSGANIEMGLVVFCTQGPYSPCSVQRFGWTKNLEYFRGWLSTISFCGGGIEDSNVAQGLAEALMVATQTTQTIQKHCVLVAASNPNIIPSVVPRPPGITLENANADLVTQPWVANVDKVAEAFTKCRVSLSVIAPRKIPKLVSIFNAGNGNASATTDEKTVELVLLSQSFKDAFSTNPEPALESTATHSVSVQPTHSVSVQPTGRPSSDQTGDKIMVEHHPTPNPVSHAVTMDMEVPSTVSMTSALRLPTVSAASLSHMKAISGQISSSSGQSSRDEKQKVPSSSPHSAHSNPRLSTPSSANSTPRLSTPSCAASLSHMTLQAISGQSSGDKKQKVSSSSGHSTRRKKRNVDAADGRNLNPFVNNTSHQFGTVTAPAQNVSVLNNPQQTRQVMSSPALPQTSIRELETTVNAPASMYISNIRAGLTSAAASIGLVGVGERAPNAAVNTFGSSANTGFTSGNAVTGLGQSVPRGAVARSEREQCEVETNQTVPAAMRHVGPSSLRSRNLQLPSTTTVAQQPVATAAGWHMVWEGKLGCLKENNHFFISELQAFSRDISSRRIAADWPSTLNIERINKTEDLKSKGKAEFLRFRTLDDDNSYLRRLKELNCWARIELPTQTLLLCNSDGADQMRGLVFPKGSVAYIAQLPSQQQERQRQKTEGLPLTVAQNQFPDKTRPQVMSRGHKQQQRQQQDGQPQGISTAGLTFVECQFPDQRSHGIGQEVAYSQFPPDRSQLTSAGQLQQQHQFPPHTSSQLVPTGQQQQQHQFPPHTIPQHMPSGQQQQQYQFPPLTKSQFMPTGQQQQHQFSPLTRSELMPTGEQLQQHQFPPHTIPQPKPSGQQQQQYQFPPQTKSQFMPTGQQQQHQFSPLTRSQLMPTGEQLQQHQFPPHTRSQPTGEQLQQHQFPPHTRSQPTGQQLQQHQFPPTRSQGGHKQQQHDQQNPLPQGLPPQYMSHGQARGQGPGKM